MGLLDKMLDAMKYDDGDEYEDDTYYDDDYDEKPSHSSRNRAIKSQTINDEEDSKAKPQQRSTPRNGRNRMMSNGMEVCVIKPTSVEDAREITDTLLDNHTVLLNMEGLDVDMAQRIIDFTSGSTYAIDGNLQKISHYIFILTPKNVDVSGDFQEILSGAFDVPALNNKF
ncbi:MAG: cell division protein SepF [Lachnospiraceae bacterium]|nr:cell division protein SepF [Lachnospiraceae bacterium]